MTEPNEEPADQRPAVPLDDLLFTAIREEERAFGGHLVVEHHAGVLDFSFDGTAELPDPDDGEVVDYGPTQAVYLNVDRLADALGELTARGWGLRMDDPETLRDQLVALVRGEV